MHKSKSSNPRPNVAALARKLKVNRRTITAWRDDEGIDLYDESALAAGAGAKANREKASGSISEARLEKLRAETARIRHAHQVEQGLYVSAEKVRADGQRIGMAIKAALLKSSND